MTPQERRVFTVLVGLFAVGLLREPPSADPDPHPSPRLAGRATLGIIGGSGPEAGLDLAAKVIEANRRRVLPLRRQADARPFGDHDAPRFTLLDVPELGRSMDLAAQKAPVWDALRGAYLELDFRKLGKYISHHKRTVIHRDIGTYFGLQALAAYDAFCSDRRMYGPELCDSSYSGARV